MTNNHQPLWITTIIGISSLSKQLIDGKQPFIPLFVGFQPSQIGGLSDFAGPSTVINPGVAYRYQALALDCLPQGKTTAEAFGLWGVAGGAPLMLFFGSGWFRI